MTLKIGKGTVVDMIEGGSNSSAPQAADRGVRIHAYIPFQYTLFPLGAVTAAAVACCAFRHDAVAGLAMLLCALFIGFFARERMTVVGVIVPAYLAVLFSGKFALPAVYVGICVAVGVGAFLFRVNRIAFAVSALLGAAAGALMLGPAGVLPGLAFVPPALVLAYVYPRSTVGEAVASTAASTALSAAGFGLLFILLSPEYGLPDGVVGMGSFFAWLKDGLIESTLSRYASLGVDAGSGAVEQYVDSILRMLPGLAAVAAEVLAFFSVSVCGAVFRGLEIEPEEFTRAPGRYVVSPVTGGLYFAASLAYVIFASDFAEGAPAVVCENLMLALALPLAVYAVSAARRAAKKAELNFLGTLVTVIAAAAVLFAGWQGVCLFAAVGGVICIIIPIRRLFFSLKKED